MSGLDEADADPAEWQGEFEPQADLGPFTIPTRAEAAELVDRYGRDYLAEVVQAPSLWNLLLLAGRHGDVIRSFHRLSCVAAPETAERPRGYIIAAMKREAAAVLAAPPELRPQRLSKARKNLERFIMEGLHARELDAFLDRLEAHHRGH